MKKGLLLAGAAALSMTAFAQKTVVESENTQARMLNVESSAYFKPLTVELDVMQNPDQATLSAWSKAGITWLGRGKVTKTYPLTEAQILSFTGDQYVSIRSWAVFQLCKETNADVIVAATFDIKYSGDTHMGSVEIIGFPALFRDWRTISNQDIDWIRVSKSYENSEIEKIKPIIKR